MHTPLAASGMNPLADRHGRKITYLRLSITDRCNLRCRYCMPEEGVKCMDHSEILTYEELLRLSSIFISLGVEKIRLTGGEPFVRPDCMNFLEALRVLFPKLNIHVTTNGVALGKYFHRLCAMGLSGVNLSLDTLDEERFRDITRRDQWENVMKNLHLLKVSHIPLKVNTVVLDDTTDDEIINMARLIKDDSIALRFIELMPFSGKKHEDKESNLSLEERLVSLFPQIVEIKSEHIETARNFHIPNHVGRVGIIEGDSKKFCATCNKVRVTSAGLLKNCLYDKGVLNLRDLLRDGSSDLVIAQKIQKAVAGKLADGHEVAAASKSLYEESMATIGG